MDDEVIVEIPVSAEVADMLHDKAKVRAIGALISDFLRPSKAAIDPIIPLIAEIKAEARANGLTDEEIDAELAAYKAERRS